MWRKRKDLMFIQKYRVKNGMSQGELAQKMGVSSAAISMWENGVTLPRLKQLIKLALIFECTLDDLVPVSSFNLGDFDD